MLGAGWLTLSELAAVLGDGPVTYAVPSGMAAYSGDFARLPWLSSGVLRNEPATTHEIRKSLALLSTGAWEAIRVEPTGAVAKINQRSWESTENGPAAYLRADLLRVVVREKWTPEREEGFVERFFEAQQRGGDPLLVRATNPAPTDRRSAYDALVHARMLRKELGRKETEHGRVIQEAVRGLVCRSNPKPEPRQVRQWMLATGRWKGRDPLEPTGRAPRPTVQWRSRWCAGG